VSLPIQKSTAKTVAANSEIGIQKLCYCRLEIGSESGVISGFTFFFHWVFTLVYGFYHLTPLDLFPSPVDERVSFDRNRKSHVVKDLHTKV
jgi:hypothetical protein